jgi:hypothetical protein
MSISVELAELHAAVQDLERPAYFLTVGDDGRAHCVAVVSRWRDDELELEVGNRTLANARARGLVSLLWPPNDAGGYSLIVDAEITLSHGTGSGDNVVRVRPTRAVLHRPAAGIEAANQATDECASDCVPLLDRAADD